MALGTRCYYNIFATVQCQLLHKLQWFWYPNYSTTYRFTSLTKHVPLSSSPVFSFSANSNSTSLPNPPQIVCAWAGSLKFTSATLALEALLSKVVGSTLLTGIRYPSLIVIESNRHNTRPLITNFDNKFAAVH